MDTPPTRSKIQLRAPQKTWRPKAAPSTNLDTTQPKETIHRPLTAQEDNQDYWERQGEYWIRHHITLRTTLFTPTDGPGYPPISTLEPHRTTITHNHFGEVSQHKEDWTVMGNAALPFQWKGTTRFTVKKDYEYIQENHDEEQQHEHHEAHRARGLRQPQQPAPQIAEHNLTHLPYRNWCPICVQGKGRQDNYKKQQSRKPIIQVGFAYINSQQDPKTIPVLTAVDVTTQLCMAVLFPDKPSMMDYMINDLQAFIFECGRTHGILQSDKEDTLNALLKATASKVGSMTVRHSPSYSSNSQGSVERLHRTLLGQIRVVKAQVESNYSMTMSTKHCLLPWIVRHAAWTEKIATSFSQTATQALNAAGEETTSEQSANLARHYFTFHHNTRNFQKQTYGCRNTSGSEKFPKREKTTSQRNQAYKRYEQYGDYNRTSNTTSHC